jgi:hypothetical protein
VQARGERRTAILPKTGTRRDPENACTDGPGPSLDSAGPLCYTTPPTRIAAAGIPGA